MIIAVTPVGMMQVALYEIIHMVSVRYALMTTFRTMNVIRLVCLTVMLGRAVVLVFGIG